MNQATRKLDNTIENWRLWVKEIGIEVDNWDRESIDMISRQVDKIKSALNKRGYDSLYFKGIRRRE